MDRRTGLPIYDTHKAAGQALDELVARSGVDTLVFDIADVGARFYTYVWTMYDLLASAARLGLRFVVLDRPNPLGGTITEGPPLDPAFASFVGRFPLPLRHGRTAGELATLFGFDVDLRVIRMEGWRRELTFAATGLPWVMPSVNMPTPDTALVYPGTGLFEGTNFSEGRGTTRPFELVGAPYADDRFAPALTALGLPGVRFRQTWFTPTFHKHAGTPVSGVQLHVHDASAFRPVLTGLSMLHVARTLYADDLVWRGHRAVPGPPVGLRHAAAGAWTPARIRARSAPSPATPTDRSCTGDFTPVRARRARRPVRRGRRRRVSRTAAGRPSRSGPSAGGPLVGQAAAQQHPAHARAPAAGAVPIGPNQAGLAPHAAKPRISPSRSA